MTGPVGEQLRRPGAGVAAVVAAAVGTAIIVLRMAEALIQLMASAMAQPGFPHSIGLLEALLTALPFAAGFFLGLWAIAPIDGSLRIGYVVARSILVTGVAATVVFVVNASFALVIAMVSLNFAGIPLALAAALGGALGTLVTQLPLGVLAGILLWLWRKEHPPRRPLSGYIDEV
ncbi:MAG TPA: hypothetical protein VN200_11545 [Rhodoglobus sp.]|nr:hypothetical protein [Rhodoglobus sp.]